MKREFMLGSVPVVIYGEESARVFLFVHGLHGCKEEAARFAAVAVPRGWEVLAMDLPEHGGRKDGKRLVPWDVIPELQSVLRYAGGRYATIAVHATSIGAWFSMHAFADARIEKCLFVSPLVDMPAMIRGMMAAAGVDRARLKREKEIPTDAGQTLSWDCLCFAEAHPARALCPDTAVLYGGADTTVPRETIDRFVRDNECRLTVMPDGEHWFHTDAQLAYMRAFEEKALS